MNKIKYLLFSLTIVAITVNCSPDDDGPAGPTFRDITEVRLENEIEINQFLEDHYFVQEENPANPNYDRILFKPLDSPDAPADAIPIKDSEFLKSKTLLQNDNEYELFYLQLREGVLTERQPTFADSVLVTYEGFTIDNTTFDGSINPFWFDLARPDNNAIIGFREALTEFRGSSGFTENPDGTFAFNDDFGVGAVFIPSGIAYFAAPPQNSGIGAYKPIIFTIQLYSSRETDHDRDGIPSYLEDVNESRRLTDDDTDNDQNFNYIDIDDDGDGVLTSDEITIEEDGTILFPDTNGNGTPDYLDSTYPE